MVDEKDDLDLKGLFNQQDESGKVEAMKQLFSTNNLKMKTEVSLDHREAEYFSKLFVLSDILHSNVLKTYATEVLTLRISNNRKGRLEAVEVNRSIEPSEKRKGFFGRLFGG